MVHSLPEKPETWVNFGIPSEFISKAGVHEDRIMISKYTFMKPELTFFHLKNVLKFLEDHYFSIQQLPVLHLLELFNEIVLQDRIQVETSKMKRARLLMNLGLKKESDELINTVNQNAYLLNEEEKKVNFEKIKALKDVNDDLKTKNIPFNPAEDGSPLVLE